jgi:hypothetical protein
MDQIDRLSWTAGISFVSYGLSIGVRVDDPRSMERIEADLPPGWKPSPTPVVDQLYSFVAGGVEASRLRRFHVVYSGSARIARTHDAAEAFDALASSLRLYIAEASRTGLFVHAGVVGWRGKAIVIPGRSWSGKTRLVAALLSAGASYYSDEYAVFDRRGRVHAYPAPLSLRGPDGKATRVSGEMLGARAGAPLPVGLVACAEYRHGARWRPRRLSAGEGVLALLGNTIAARRTPALALTTLGRVVRTATVLEGARGGAGPTAARLLEVAAARWADAPGEV